MTPELKTKLDKIKDECRTVLGVGPARAAIGMRPDANLTARFAPKAAQALLTTIEALEGMENSMCDIDCRGGGPELALEALEQIANEWEELS